MLYTALIADVIDSKKLLSFDRRQIQIYIKECLSTLNSVFKPSLQFDVIFSAGDEVQGLFKSPTAAFLYLRLFKLVLSPLQLRCGLGIGEWDIKIPEGTSNEQDGPAYHNARAAISSIHGRNTNNALYNSNSEYDLYINTLINASSLFSKKQSLYQNQVSLLTELMFPLFDSKSMDSKEFSRIFELLQIKSEQEFYSVIKGRTDIRGKLFDNIPDDFEPVNIFASDIIDGELELVSTLKKGVSTKISNIINTSRQNIDTVIKSGNIAEIRNIDATALLLIDKAFVR